MGDADETIIRSIEALQTPWQTADPFRFCMHHDDAYPPGNEQMGPAASLAGRPLGNDFTGKDGWSMYHGRDVPGFPQHPHRGFETITIARDGFIDHSDSLGAKSRFGKGDVQWMTAGNGVVHSEMFPLLNREEGNHTELMQIWLNLPREDKEKDAYFTMFWSEDVPKKTVRDDAGREAELTVIAGAVDGLEPPSPPPSSWAAREEAEVGVWLVRMDAGASWTAPPAGEDVNRTVYVFDGEGVEIDGTEVDVGHAVEVRPDVECPVTNGSEPGEILVLQGKPIGEPVVQRGPFVMNSEGEIRQAMVDYQRTGFGGWPWEDNAPVHPRDAGRFAVHADGTEEHPDD